VASIYFLAAATVSLGTALLLPAAARSLGKPMTMQTAQHVVLLLVVPALLLLAMRAARWRSPRGGWRRPLRVVTHPVATLLHFNAAVVVWHLPVVYEQAMRLPSLHALMLAGLLLAGLCFWWPVVDPLHAAAPLEPIAKLGYLVIAGVPPTVPGVLLALARAPLYPSFPALDDQQYSGLLLFGTAKFVLLTSMAVVFFHLFRGSAGDEPREREETALTPPGPQGLPAWVRLLEQPDRLLRPEPAARALSAKWRRGR
jgi:cytochrome c oxidase assembly factor CtaG